jgi:dipeptidyl aminopeptidase/acylaminoacyl peptidase
LIPANSPGGEELLLESAQDKGATDWSRDGQFLVYHSVDPQTSWDLWVLPMEGERRPFAWLKTNFDERRGQLSPDGQWMAYMSNESGRFDVYVRPFNGRSSAGATGDRWPVSISGGISPRWRPDGRELYYIAPDGWLMATPVGISGGAFEPGTPVALFQTRMYGGGTDVGVGTQYDVSEDGRFLINTLLDEAPAPITLIQNWQPEQHP